MSGRRPSRRERILQNNAAFRFLGALTGRDASPLLTAVPKKRERGEVDEANAEAGVIREITELLACHPQILFAVRQNSGALQVQAADGTHHPIWFFRWIRQPRKMRISDFSGWTRDGKPFCIEAKRRDWSGPKSEREYEQEAYIHFIQSLGGRGGFARNVDEAKHIIDG